MVADWLAVAAVVVLVYAIYFIISHTIDSLIDFWRSYRNDS